MPPLRGPMWEHFYLGSARNSSHSDAWCRYCINHHRPTSQAQPIDISGGNAELSTNALLQADWFKEACKHVKSVNGEKKAMMNHIVGPKPCMHTPDHIKEAVRKLKEGTKVAVTSSAEASSAGSRKKKTAIIAAVENNFTQTKLQVFKGIDMPFSEEQAEMIRLQSMRATISANLPFRWLADPEVITLFLMMRSAAGSVLPSPKVLATTLLDMEASRVDADVRELLKGKVVSVSADGWSDGKSVLGVDVSYRGKSYLVRAVPMKGRGKDGVSMATTFGELIDWVELEYTCTVAGFCCDNDGGSQLGRKLLRNMRPHLFNPPCSAHQGQLILGDYFKENPDAAKTAEETVDLLGWIRSHEKVRDIFDEVQVEKNGGEPLAYLVANLTRWTTHSISFNRILALKDSMRHAVIVRRDDILTAHLGAEKNKKKVSAITKTVDRFCDMIDDALHWKRLQTVAEDIEPICYITNINQADNTRPDQVLLGLAGVFLHFKRHPNPTVRAGMLRRIEKRWAALDQTMFLFALILNPFEQMDRFGQEAAANVFTLANIAVELFTRVKFRTKPASDEPVSDRPAGTGSGSEEVESSQDKSDKERRQNELRASFLHYLSGTGPFADFKANRDVFSKSTGADPMLVWGYYCGVPETAELADLALTILGLSVNQGGNERDFSDWKIKRTRLRNKLSLEKTAKMSKVTADLRTRQEEDGLRGKRKARHNHEDDRVSELISVPRYADALEMANDQPPTTNDNHEQESHRVVVNSAKDWRRAHIQWMVAARDIDGEDDGAEMARITNSFGTATARWLPRSLDKLFGDTAKRPIAVQRRRKLTDEERLMELLAAEFSDEEPDDGALEGSGDEYEEV
ncbi:unnamed protein product [Mycena citricolor]|uniref:DUF659 domain-containing protein n=1 Tax=Mycena citricolor TaxID=2018698 RepID=A0AAD2JXI3_9AGAR|nr:unnamed protein product [Mycena citricolor]